jgi:hypothetical protein
LSEPFQVTMEPAGNPTRHRSSRLRPAIINCTGPWEAGSGNVTWSSGGWPGTKGSGKGRSGVGEAVAPGVSVGEKKGVGEGVGVDVRVMVAVIVFVDVNVVVRKGV